MHEFINSLLETDRQLMIEESKTQNDTYELTDPEKVAQGEAKKCKNCCRPFDEVKVIKTCHHSWDTEIVYGSNGEVVKSNYINITNRNVKFPFFDHNATQYCVRIALISRR